MAKFEVTSLGVQSTKGAVGYIFKIKHLDKEWAVSREFFQFDQLDANLRQLPGAKIGVSLPHKFVLGLKASDEVIKARQEKLTAYLQAVLDDPIVAANFLILRFLSEGKGDIMLLGDDKKQPTFRIQVAKCGYMVKIGDVRKSLKRRFFVLADQLYYFKDPEDVNPVGMVVLAGKCSVEDVTTEKHYEHGFCINTPGRKWQFFTETDKHKRSWINAVRATLMRGDRKVKYEPLVKPAAVVTSQLELPGMKTRSLTIVEASSDDAVSIQVPPTGGKEPVEEPKPDEPKTEETKEEVKEEVKEDKPEDVKEDKPEDVKEEVKEDAKDLGEEKEGEKEDVKEGEKGDATKDGEKTEEVPEEQKEEVKEDQVVPEDAQVAEEIPVGDEIPIGDTVYEKIAVPELTGDPLTELEGAYAQYDTEGVGEVERKDVRLILEKFGLEIDSQIINGIILLAIGDDAKISKEKMFGLATELHFLHSQFNSINVERDDEVERGEISKALEMVGFEFAESDVQIVYENLQNSMGTVAFDSFSSGFFFIRALWEAFGVIAESTNVVSMSDLPKLLLGVKLEIAEEVIRTCVMDLQEKNVLEHLGPFNFLNCLAIALALRVPREEVVPEEVVAAPKIVGEDADAWKIVDPEELGEINIHGLPLALAALGFDFHAEIMSDIVRKIDLTGKTNLTFEEFKEIVVYLRRLKTVYDEHAQTENADGEKCIAVAELKGPFGEFDVKLTDPQMEAASCIIQLKGYPSTTFPAFTHLIYYDQLLKLLFKSIDEDGTGKIDVATVPDLIPRVGLRVTAEILEAELHSYETEKGDLMTYEEFFIAVMHMRVARPVQQKEETVLKEKFELSFENPLCAMAYSPPKSILPPVLVLAESPRETPFTASTISVFNPETNELVSRLPASIQGEIRAIKFSSDGCLFTTVSFVPFRRADTHEGDYGLVSTQVWDGFTNESLFLSVRRSTEWVFRNDTRKALRLVDFAPPPPQKRSLSGFFKKKKKDVSLKVDLRCNMMAVVSAWNAVDVWNVRTNSLVTRFKVSYDTKQMKCTFNEVKFLPRPSDKKEDKKLFVCDLECVRIFNYQTNSEEHTIKHPTGVLSFSPDTKQICGVGCGDAPTPEKNKLKIWDTKSRKRVKKILPGYRPPFEKEDTHTKTIRHPCISFSPSASQIAIVSSANDACLWNYQSERAAETFTVGSVESQFAQEALKGVDLTTLKNELRKAKQLIDPINSECRRIVIPLAGPAEYVEYSFDGKTILVQGLRHEVGLTPAIGHSAWPLPIPGPVYDLRVHNAETGEIIYEKEQIGKDEEISSLAFPTSAFSSDGRNIAYLEGKKLVIQPLPELHLQELSTINFAPLHQQEIILAVCEGKRNAIASVISKYQTDVNFVSEIHGVSPLMMAVKHGDLKMVVKLLQLGANPSYARPIDGLSPLHVACVERKPKVVLSLLQSGADPNSKWRPNDLTPLHCSVARGYDDIIKILVEKTEGLKIDEEDAEGRSAFFYAVDKGNTKALTYLSAHGADVGQRTRTGSTALHHAARQDDKDMTKLLIKQGTDVTAVDSHGKTIFDINAPLARKFVKKKEWPEGFSKK